MVVPYAHYDGDAYGGVHAFSVALHFDYHFQDRLVFVL